MGRLKQFFRFLFIAVLFPFTIHYIAYFGFVSNYGKNVYSVESFKNHYESGLYRFRVLGRLLQLKTFKIVEENTELEKKQSAHVFYLDKKGNDGFYFTYFLINCFFNILTVIIFLLTLSNRKLFSLPDKMVNIFTLFATLLVGFTLYVVTPYDALSYFLILVCCSIILQLIIKPSVTAYLIFLLILAVATFTRESSAIALAFYAALIFVFRKKLQNKLSHFWFLAGAIAWFLTCYFALRIRLGFSNGFYQSNTIMYLFNLTDMSAIAGGLFFIILIYSIYTFSQLKENRLLFSAFLLFSAPYLFLCWYTGIFFETRLWIPVLLPALLLINIDTEKIKLQINPETENNKV